MSIGITALSVNGFVMRELDWTWVLVLVGSAPLSTLQFVILEGSRFEVHIFGADDQLVSLEPLLGVGFEQ